MKTFLHVSWLYFIPIHEKTIVNTTTANPKPDLWNSKILNPWIKKYSNTTFPFMELIFLSTYVVVKKL